MPVPVCLPNPLPPVRLRFLGAGDSQGVPRWFCECDVCREARTSGRNLRHRPAALLTAGNRRILIDAPPELRLQLVRHGLTTLDAAFLTHAHNDHVGGVVDLYDFVRWTRAALPVHIPARSHAALLTRYPWLTEHLDLRCIDGPVDCHGARFTPFEIPHGKNGFAHGYRIEAAGLSLAYVSDALDLPEPLVDARLRDLDLLILGTSFWKEEFPHPTRSVYDVQEALALTARIRPRRTVFTHLGHGVDVATPLPPGHEFARDGLEIELTGRSTADE